MQFRATGQDRLGGLFVIIIRWCLPGLGIDEVEPTASEAGHGLKGIIIVGAIICSPPLHAGAGDRTAVYERCHSQFIAILKSSVLRNRN